jgi:basic membrane protein A
MSSSHNPSVPRGFGHLVARAVGAALAAALLLSSSACARQEVSSTPTPVAFKACMVSNRDGFQDGAANAAAYYGLLQSEAQFGPRTSAIQMGADATIDDFKAALTKLVSRHCNLIFGVGQQLIAPIRQAAQANPGVDFALVDATLSSSTGSELALRNVKNIEFDSTQAAFIAGYLAAAKTASSSVGVVGGAKSEANLNEVTAFKQGVAYFDLQQSETTVVLGAIGESTQAWNFAGRNLTDAQVGGRVANLVNAGADVVFGVGLSGLQLAKLVASHAGTKLIGSGTDFWSQTEFANFKGIMLASIVKNFSDAVVKTVGDAVAGNFIGGTGGSWLGTLESGDVSLSQEHDISYGMGLQSELDSIRSDLISGKIVVQPATN